MELEKQGRKFQLHTPEFCVFHMEFMLESIKNIPPTKALHETTVLGKIFKPKGCLISVHYLIVMKLVIANKFNLLDISKASTIEVKQLESN